MRESGADVRAVALYRLAIRTIGGHPGVFSALLASVLIVASECAQVRRYSPTICSRVSSAVAHMSADGAGKLLALISGPVTTAPGFEMRFSKPPGMRYPDLYARLKPWTDRREVSL